MAFEPAPIPKTKEDLKAARTARKDAAKAKRQARRARRGKGDR